VACTLPAAAAAVTVAADAGWASGDDGSRAEEVGAAVGRTTGAVIVKPPHPGAPSPCSESGGSDEEAPFGRTTGAVIVKPPHPASAASASEPWQMSVTSLTSDVTRSDARFSSRCVVPRTIFAKRSSSSYVWGHCVSSTSPGISPEEAIEELNDLQRVGWEGYSVW
jgi:hypothetical protein